MPSFTHGKAVTVLMDGYDLSSYFSSATSSGTADTAEVTTFGASAKSYIPGQKDATVSVEGYYSGVAEGVDDYLQGVIAGEGVWSIVIADALAARGYGAKVVDTSYEIGAEVGGAVSVSAEGQSTTGQEGVVVLAPLAAATATGTGTQVDNTDSTANGAACYLHVTAASGTTPTLDVVVEHSADASTWVTLATFAQVAAGGNAERVAVTGTVNRYLRASWTISGTSPSFTFHVSAARL
jgi:hypothetical protein